MSGDTFYHSIRIRAARRDHSCGYCYRTIHKGEPYLRNAGVWEGDFWNAKECTHCSAFSAILNRVDSDYEGDLLGWVENIGTDPGSVCEYQPALSLYRWSRWFVARWHDEQGQLRPVPVLP